VENIIKTDLNDKTKDLPSIFIGQPSIGGIRPEHVMNVVGWFMSGKYRVAYHPVIGKIPHDAARNQLVADFLDDGTFDYMLFLDANTVASYDTLEKLLATDKDMVSATAQTFKVTSNNNKHIVPTSFRYNEEKGGYSYNFGIGIEEVDITHMACTLVKREVLEDISPPWFSFEFANKEGTLIVGEEFTFCRRVKEAGYKIFNRYDILSHHFVTVDTNMVNSVVVNTHNKAVASTVEAIKKDGGVDKLKW